MVVLLALTACSWSAGRQTVAAPSGPVTTVTTSAPAAPPPTAAPTTAATEPPTTAAPAATTAPEAAPAAGSLPAAITTKDGVTLPVVDRQVDAYTVALPCGGTALAHGAPTPPITVVLDPGHGGRESGAVASSGLAEKTVNLAVALQAQKALQQAGISTVLTHVGDYGMTLDARSQLAMALKPKVFVSIHHNAEPDGPWPKPGSETYYQIAYPDSKRLAGLLYEEIVTALSQYNISWVADTDAGAKYRTGSTGNDYYAVLRQTHGVIAALAELAFVSNPPEADLVAQPQVQQVEGQAVAKAIIRYLTTKDPGSGFTIPYPRATPAGGGGGPSGCFNPPIS